MAAKKKGTKKGTKKGRADGCVQLNVWVRPEQRAEVQRDAKKAGVGVSEHVRSILFGKKAASTAAMLARKEG